MLQHSQLANSIFFAAATSAAIEGMILIGSIFVLRAWGQVVLARFRGAGGSWPAAIWPFTLCPLVFLALVSWLTSRPQFSGPSTEVKDTVIGVSFVASLVLLLLTRHLVRRNGGPAIVASGCKALLVITMIYLFFGLIVYWPSAS